MKNRSELREIIMKVLYQVFILSESEIKFNVDDLIKEQLEIKNEFVTDAIDTILKNKTEIYDLANRYLDSWPMDRLNKVDQAILSLGIYELKYTETPPVVAINEAVELSKKYSDEKVTKMINAVLDEIYHESEA
jgi:N utilization substance protein B